MSETASYRKPLPLPDEDSHPYFTALKEHRLVIQKCDDCGAYRFRPKFLCTKCLSERATWTPISGKGTIWSWVVVHQPMVPGFQDELPYAVVVVALAEGPRMSSNLLDCPLGDIRVGMPVEVVFCDVTKEITLPKFRPVKG